MKKNKLYVIKKYIYAESAAKAIKAEKDLPVDDCWVDEDWRRNNLANPEPKPIGFKQ